MTRLQTPLKQGRFCVLVVAHGLGSDPFPEERDLSPSDPIRQQAPL